MAVFMNVIGSDKYIFMNHCEIEKKIRLNVVFSIKIILDKGTNPPEGKKGNQYPLK